MSRFGRHLPRAAVVHDVVAGVVSPVVKVHRCTPEVTRTFTLEEWHELPLIGEHRFDVPPFRLELRDCPCKSTLAIWTDRDGNPVNEDGTPLEQSAPYPPRGGGLGRRPASSRDGGAGLRSEVEEVRAALTFAERSEP